MGPYFRHLTNLGYVYGYVTGRQKAFLEAAEKQFKTSIPEHLVIRVRGASPDQLDVWHGMLQEASNLESVFSGSGDSVASGQPVLQFAWVALAREIKRGVETFKDGEMLRMAHRNAFLKAAEERFQSVPDHLAARVSDASSGQILVWLDRLHIAPDLKSVFNGSGNGDASE